MSFFSCLGGPKNEEIFQEWGIPFVCGEKSWRSQHCQAGLHKGRKGYVGIGKIEDMKRRINSTHFVHGSQDLCKVPIHPKDLETGKEKGIYEVKTILKEKLKNTMN